MDDTRVRPWLGRGYAGTQVLLALPWMLTYGALGGLPRDILLSAAWVINLALAEWIIQRQKS